jgi:hypothetical protein
MTAPVTVVRLAGATDHLDFRLQQTVSDYWQQGPTTEIVTVETDHNWNDPL